MDKFECDLCGKTFKSLGGLEGHKRLSHSQGTKKTYPDEIGERLAALEAAAISSTNPGNTIQTEDKVITALKLLLPAMERYGLAIVNCPMDEGDGYWSDWPKKYRIVNNADVLDRRNIDSIQIRAKAKVY